MAEIPRLPDLARELRDILRRLDVAERAGRGAARVVLGYAEATNIQSGITSETNLTGLAVTVDVPAGRRIGVVCSGTVSGVDAGARAFGRLRDHNDIGLLQWCDFVAGVNSSRLATERTRNLTGLSGVWTFRMSLQIIAGTGSVTSIAAASNPAFIRVDDLGPA